MVFLLAEWIRGKPVDEQWQARLTIAGVLCLLALMAFVILNDASNLIPLLGR
jgi:regulator of sigma E protease